MSSFDLVSENMKTGTTEVVCQLALVFLGYDLRLLTVANDPYLLKRHKTTYPSLTFSHYFNLFVMFDDVFRMLVLSLAKVEAT